MEKHYSIETVFNMLGEEALSIKTQPTHTKESIEVGGFKIYKKSLRYATFYQKGCKCCVCGKEGTYFQLDADRDGGNIEGRRHFNLYAEDGTLMTKDHILPKRWGGKDDIDNMQTMCKDCNEAKGSQYDVPVLGIKAVNKDNPEKVVTFMSINAAAYWLCDRAKVLSTAKDKRPGKTVQKTLEIALGLADAIDSKIPYYNYFWTKEEIELVGKPFNGGNN
jgi:5-methylcytosine-specific restriction endonuclease McrA